jgi:hypothetical protein
MPVTNNCRGQPPGYNNQEGIGMGITIKYRAQCLSIEPKLPFCVHIQNPHQHTHLFCFGDSKQYFYFKKYNEVRPPSLPAEPASEGASGNPRSSGIHRIFGAATTEAHTKFQQNRSQSVYDDDDDND